MRLLKKIKETSGMDGTVEEGFLYYGRIILYVVFLLIFCFLIRIKLVYTFADELIRTAELYGYVGTVTDEKQEKLEKILGISPEVEWSKTGKLDLNEEIILYVNLPTPLRLPFGLEAVFDISKTVVGTSEVYWK